MPYPFYASPLEDFTRKYRSLCVQQNHYLDISRNIELQADMRMSAQKSHREIMDLASQLYRGLEIPERTFDVFTNPVEIALAEFIGENPEPFNVWDCAHPVTDVRLRVHQDGSEHVVVQCEECGRELEKILKSEVPNWRMLAKFDPSITDVKGAPHDEWVERRYGVYKEAKITGDSIPEFDSKDFEEKFILNDPMPFDVTLCTHNEVMNTWQVYDSGHTAVVVQCVTCGKHRRALPTNSFESPELLPDFNKTLSKELGYKYSGWNERRVKAREEARRAFMSKRSDDIASGVYVFKVNDTFNTYYDSPEWRRTRQRITTRDNNKCQACDLPAQCVHHLTYDRLGCENDLDLISLCNNCHYEVHLRQDSVDGYLKLSPMEISDLWAFGSEDISVYFDEDVELSHEL